VLNVQSNRKSVSHGFLAGIFGTLDRFGVVVDLIQARLVRDLEKIGIVRFFKSLPVFRPRSQLVVLRVRVRVRGHSTLGIRTSRYGDTLDGRKTDAQYGRHRGTHVHDSSTRKRQH